MNRSLLNDFLVIVVLYKKKVAECLSIQTIVNSATDVNPDIYVYDNSPEYNASVPEILGNCKIKYVADSGNPGVSRAYNLGSAYAKSISKDWLLLCDQDTAFTADYFNHMQHVVQDLQPTLIAPYLFSNNLMISPCAFTVNYGRPLKKIPVPGWISFSRISLLNSGMIVKRTAFEACGGYNEKVFLDFSDFEFIKRFKQLHGRFYLLETRLEHHLEASFHQEFNAARFIKYCRSYRGAIHNPWDLLSISSIVMLRSVRLVIRHRNLSPLRYCIRNFVLN